MARVSQRSWFCRAALGRVLPKIGGDPAIAPKSVAGSNVAGRCGMNPRHVVRHGLLFAVTATVSSCGNSEPRKPPPDPGTPIVPTASVEETAERERVTAALAEVADLDAAGLEARYPAVFAASL